MSTAHLPKLVERAVAAGHTKQYVRYLTFPTKRNDTGATVSTPDFSKIVESSVLLAELVKDLGEFPFVKGQRPDIVVGLQNSHTADSTTLIGKALAADCGAEFVALNIDRPINTLPALLCGQVSHGKAREATDSQVSGVSSKQHGIGGKHVVLLSLWVDELRLHRSVIETLQSNGVDILGLCTFRVSRFFIQKVFSELNVRIHELWPRREGTPEVNATSGLSVGSHQGTMELARPGSGSKGRKRSRDQVGLTQTQQDGSRQTHRASGYSFREYSGQTLGIPHVWCACEVRSARNDQTIACSFYYSSAKCEANTPGEDEQAFAVISETEQNACSSTFGNQGTGGDSTPDDATFQVPPLFLCAVFDGHGGRRAVDHISSSLFAHIAESFFSEEEVHGSQSTPGATPCSHLSRADHLPSKLEACFLECDQRYLDELCLLEERDRMSRGACNSGCCVVLAALQGASLLVANCGDCRAVLGRTNDQAIDSPARQRTDEIRDSSPRIIGGSSSPVRFTALQLSTDHTCNSSTEVTLLKQRTRDRNPVRRSHAEDANNNGPLRVAGSLAVTRAMGDAYLKIPSCSRPPFISKLPYITAQPEVRQFTLTNRDRVLILGSDGLWEFLGNEEAVDIVLGILREDVNADPGEVKEGAPDDKWTPQNMAGCSYLRKAAMASSALVKRALELACKARGVRLTTIAKIPPGVKRRALHDDISCSVVVFEWGP